MSPSLPPSLTHPLSLPPSPLAPSPSLLLLTIIYLYSPSSAIPFPGLDTIQLRNLFPIQLDVQLLSV